MKKYILASIIFIFTINLNAQTNKDQAKLLGKKDKALTNEITDKATKQSRKESKRLQKEGWKVAAGALPMDKQLDECWKKQFEKDDLGFPKYIVANSITIGTNYSAAKNQAINLSKAELAGLIATQIAGLVENTVANQDLSQQEAASIVKTVDASKNIIAQEIGRIMVIFEAHRKLSNKNTEVQVRIAYNSAMAMESAKKTIIKKLESEGSNLHNKLDGLLGLDKMKDIQKNSNVLPE
jgi:hypothetical protein